MLESMRDLHTIFQIYAALDNRWKDMLICGLRHQYLQLGLLAETDLKFK